MLTRFIFLICLATAAAISAGSVRNGALRVGSRKDVARGGVTVSPLLRALRPNYPYSVVPGGVYTPDELRQAIANSPELREHYAGIDLNALRLVKNTAERYAYVSFRANKALFWTTRKLRIAPGEVLLTDGRVFIKTRCGNRLSDSPIIRPGTPSIPDAVLSPAPLTEDTLGALEFTPTPPGPVSLSKKSSPLGFSASNESHFSPMAIETGTSSPLQLPALQESAQAEAVNGYTGLSGGFGSLGKTHSVRVAESSFSPVPEAATSRTVCVGLLGALAAARRKRLIHRFTTAMRCLSR